MQKDSRRFLEALHNAESPSGSEHKAKAVFKEYVKGSIDSITNDCIGNTVACLEPLKPKGSIMLAGHIDEIGLMVRYIDENGYLFCSAVGGIDPAVLPGKRVRFVNRKGSLIPGVIGKKPIHLLDAKDREKAVSMDDLFVDIGCLKKKEAEKMIDLGDVGVIDHGLTLLHNDLAVARAFDDRIGVYIIAEVLKKLAPQKKKLNYRVLGVATTQEEIGLRGATVAAYNIKPDLAIALDVTHAIDYPDISKKKFGDISLGKGGAIVRGPNIHPWISNRLIETARQKKIPHQLLANPRPTGTDANTIQITRGGIPAGLIGIPLRYMHTPSEVLSLKDVDSIVNLVCEFILSLKDEINFSY
ncbi:MAG: M42 family metallopeptidase [Candidatus Wallbacteria bacterium]|nr:M42 family metallopeptidase [Candidatus Wallbacteria bacterium]